jgi:hypothetical protein
MGMTGKNGIMIYGPKADGTYIVEFKTASGEALAISIPARETRVVRYFQERMPTGCLCRTFRGTEPPVAKSHKTVAVRPQQSR